ncbi:HNH endonuclease [Schinkia azotoformans]|uniref:HNH endonuclease n=1 Tax=Schinkia azotoformans TaxID=1454 RepID=UPI002DB57BA8|nr:HNH endonuclease [Schinkia azotoformans]MEC1697745.1 HNH endonuclease [Schinkia azotoformans]
MRVINGYIVVFKPDHPKSYKDGYIYEHILVAEKMLGRPLRENEDVHHIDFNVQNNLPENLLILGHGQHRKLHNFINRYNLRPVFENTALIGHYVRKCEYCSEYLLENQKFCNKECQEKFKQLKRDTRPSYEELEVLLEDMNKVDIGKLYGVHRTTINSWIRDYEKEMKATS